VKAATSGAGDGREQASQVGHASRVGASGARGTSEAKWDTRRSNGRTPTSKHSTSRNAMERGHARPCRKARNKRVRVRAGHEESQHEAKRC
jgi:hypothetical protein